MPATQEALRTAELLEQILINVNDIHTLLFSQRVSHYWRELISGSTKLQRKLFFMPASTSDLISLGIAPLAAGGTRGEQPVLMVAADLDVGQTHACTDFAVLNPFLLWYGVKKGTIVDGGNTCTARPRGTAISCSPSWKRMLAMQPPRVRLLASTSIRATEFLPGDCLLGRAFEVVDTLMAVGHWKDYEGDILLDATCTSSKKFWDVVEIAEPVKVGEDEDIAGKKDDCASKDKELHISGR